MDNDKSFNNQVAEEGKKGSFVDILYVLRSHVLFIIIVAILFGAGGYLYSRVRKPVYTASVPVKFDVEIKNDEGVDQVSSTNYLFAYLDTAVGVCTGGEVIDRANVYYNFYLKRDRKQYKNIDEFINHMYELYTDEVKSVREEIPGYEVTPEDKQKYRDMYFRAGEVGSSYKSDDVNTVVNFKLWVKNLDAGAAREMARIYTLAADITLNQTLDFDEKSSKATAGLTELNKYASGVSVGSDMATNRIVIIALVLGVLMSFVAIYVMYLVDNTVKSKEMLEEMAGANVIAYIDDVAEVK